MAFSSERGIFNLYYYYIFLSTLGERPYADPLLARVNPTSLYNANATIERERKYSCSMNPKKRKGKKDNTWKNQGEGYKDID